MTDYVSNYNGAGKDAEESVVKAVQFDQEFSSIALAVGTKIEPVSSPTNGNLLSVDGNGIAEDSGIASANLDSLTSNVQTQLDSKIPTLSVVTDYVKAGLAQRDGGSANVNLVNEIEDPSTATNYNVQFTIPAGITPVMIYLEVFVYWLPSSSTGHVLLRAGHPDIAGVGFGSSSTILDVYSREEWGDTFYALVPCDENGNVLFRVTHSGSGAVLDFYMKPVAWLED